MLTSLTIEVEAHVLAEWAREAAVSGISLAEWASLRLGAVSVAPRTRDEVVALRVARGSVEGYSPDDELPDADEVVVSAPRVAVASKHRGGAKVKNIAGEKFGLLTAVDMVGRDEDGNRLWRCRCDCGGEKVARTGCLTSGNVRSCGCLRGGGRRAKV